MVEAITTIIAAIKHRAAVDIQVILKGLTTTSESIVDTTAIVLNVCPVDQLSRLRWGQDLLIRQEMHRA